jgi:hypothetical protein
MHMHAQVTRELERGMEQSAKTLFADISYARCGQNWFELFDDNGKKSRASFLFSFRFQSEESVSCTSQILQGLFQLATMQGRS